MTLFFMQNGRLRDPVVIMRRRNKTSLINRTAGILRNEDGASIVLVTIISIIVVASIIILSINVNTLIASADRQYFRDQAYEAATSMGLAIDKIISNNQLELKDYADGSVILSNSSDTTEVNVIVKPAGIDLYTVTVTAETADETYIYTATYYGSNKTYMRVS